jgi:hypothetical protein
MCTEIDPETEPGGSLYNPADPDPRPYGTYEYTDPNTNKTFTERMYLNEIKEFCSNSRPFFVTGKAYIGPGNYDVYKVRSRGCKGFRVNWSSPYTLDNTALDPQGPWLDGWSAVEFNLTNVLVGLLVVQVLPFAFLGIEAVVIIGGIVVDGGRALYATVAVGGTVSTACRNRWYDIACKCSVGQEYIPPIGESPRGVIDFTRSRRSSVKCGETTQLPAITTDASKYRHVFNSPETSFGQPFLGNVLKLENVMYGAGTGHFVAVNKNAKYKLISKEAQEDALRSSDAIARMTDPFNFTATFTAYQAYLTIYINGITRKNYAYSFNSIASYDYYGDIENNPALAIKQRNIDITQYLIPGVQSVGDNHNINNFNRESSVFIKTIEDRNTTITVPPLLFPNDVPSISINGSPGISDYSRYTITSSDRCITPAEEKDDVTVVSYYASMKNVFDNQWDKYILMKQLIQVFKKQFHLQECQLPLYLEVIHSFLDLHLKQNFHTLLITEWELLMIQRYSMMRLVT